MYFYCADNDAPVTLQT